MCNFSICMYFETPLTSHFFDTFLAPCRPFPFLSFVAPDLEKLAKCHIHFGKGPSGKNVDGGLAQNFPPQLLRLLSFLFSSSSFPLSCPSSSSPPSSPTSTPSSPLSPPFFSLVPFPFSAASSFSFSYLSSSLSSTFLFVFLHEGNFSSFTF